MASFLTNLVAPVILGKPSKVISHLYVVVRATEVIQPTGDFYHDRYIACPSAYKKKMYVIFSKERHGGYEGIDLNSPNWSTEFRSGAFDARNSSLNGGYVTILGCLEADGRLRRERIGEWCPRCDDETDEKKKQEWETNMTRWEKDKQTKLTQEECDGELEVGEHMDSHERIEALRAFFEELPEMVLPKCLQELKETVSAEEY